MPSNQIGYVLALTHTTLLLYGSYDPDVGVDFSWTNVIDAGDKLIQERRWWDNGQIKGRMSINIVI